MTWSGSLIVIARFSVVLLAFYHFSSWRAVAIGLAIGLTIIENAPSGTAKWKPYALMAAAWTVSFLVFWSFLAEDNRLLGIDFASVGFLAGLAILPVLPNERAVQVTSTSNLYPAAAIPRKLLALVWLLFTAAELLRGGYTYNNAAVFWTGVAGMFVADLLLLWSFRMATICAQASITLLLLLVGLPVVDHFIRPVPEIHDPVPDFEKYYSYEGARKDPDMPVAWARYSIRKWWDYQKKAFYRDGPVELPIRFRPNTRTKLYYSEVSINSLGFRGHEFSREKTNTYRIITLGESTTFGVTLSPDHRPWPELLEGLIRARLKTGKSVEVINAGFPGRTLPQNIYRLKHELLGLDPDMIISYHGFNGFGMLNQAIPPVSAAAPPEYTRRPVRLLAAVEYHVKLSLYKKRHRMTAAAEVAKADPSKSMSTPYADAYRELIRITQMNHIKLVLANYSMAVNAGSDPDLIEFYRGPFPAVHARIRANQAHSTIVKGLAKENPDICFVDTHPSLDGRHQFFEDLIHFDKKGEEQMAETFFAGISAGLEEQLESIPPSKREKLWLPR